MKVSELYGQFLSIVSHATGYQGFNSHPGRSEPEISAAQWKEIDNHWMELCFKESAEAKLQELLAAKARDGKAKGASA